MAALIPQEKSVELIQTYGGMLQEGISINELEYMRSVKELDRFNSVNSLSALGFLHAIAGKFAKANDTFERALLLYDDQSLAVNFCYMLDKTQQFELLGDVVYRMANRFETKQITKMAYSYAYRFGNREALIEFMDKHIKLLSEEEGRDMAEKHKHELLGELNDAYHSTGCSEKQLQLISKITNSVIKEYGAKVGRIEVSRNGSRSYVVDILNKDPELIAEMNYRLAEVICEEEELDDCELTARFSPFRDLHAGVSYGCNVN
ncbi:hypothetical protein NHB29_11900 [Pantoea agglomerans]|uniref:hypothetical protein n=1 Tax=Enterobacter agglomerans TaxID=549 RepID=UPI0027383C86|nr:hypothetical protein [Pantoea agglomerans]WLO83411.1 hypothetical protein NHB29_11900 [Pantoea agglomerans]